MAFRVHSMLPKPSDLREITAEFNHGKSLRDILAYAKFRSLQIMVRVSDVDHEEHRLEDAFLQVEAFVREPPRASYYLDGTSLEIETGKLHDIHSPNSTFEFDPGSVWDLVEHNMRSYLKGTYTYMRPRKP